MKLEELTIHLLWLIQIEKKHWCPWFIQTYFSVVRVNKITGDIYLIFSRETLNSSDLPASGIFSTCRSYVDLRVILELLQKIWADITIKYIDFYYMITTQIKSRRDNNWWLTITQGAQLWHRHAQQSSILGLLWLYRCHGRIWFNQ